MSNGKFSVDMDAMAHTITAMRQSVNDMHGIWAKVTTGDFDIPDGTFTLLDPGVLESYSEVRTYIVQFLADMESRFTNMATELEAVLNAYGDTELGSETRANAISGELHTTP
jgi:hypothetical protein